MQFTAVGDALIQKRMPNDYKGFEEIQRLVSGSDFSFFNLETTINNGEYYPEQYCGGTYLRATPAMLEDVYKYGFNSVSICNNHSMDFSHNGLLATKRYVEEIGLIQSGVGANLDEAMSPAYIDTNNGRIALIGVTASGNEAAEAGPQSRRFPGRPGVNRVYYDLYYEIEKDDMENLKAIAQRTHVNGIEEISQAEGYRDKEDDDRFSFKTVKFRVGNNGGSKTSCRECDLKKMKKLITEAQFQADYVVISVHSHQSKNADKEQPEDFLREFAHYCIDQGANAIIGHGPHILRGVEIYKGMPIFYSLGNFIMHNENIPYAPKEFYGKYCLTDDDTMYDLFKKRSNGFTKGLWTQKRCFESVVARWEMIDGHLDRIELLPIEMGYGEPRSIGGWPKLANEDDILIHLQELSKPYDTVFEINDNTATVRL